MRQSHRTPYHTSQIYIGSRSRVKSLFLIETQRQFFLLGFLAVRENLTRLPAVPWACCVRTYGDGLGHSRTCVLRWSSGFHIGDARSFFFDVGVKIYHWTNGGIFDISPKRLRVTQYEKPWSKFLTQDAGHCDKILSFLLLLLLQKKK